MAARHFQNNFKSKRLLASETLSIFPSYRKINLRKSSRCVKCQLGKKFVFPCLSVEMKKGETFIILTTTTKWSYHKKKKSCFAPFSYHSTKTTLLSHRKKGKKTISRTILQTLTYSHFLCWGSYIDFSPFCKTIMSSNFFLYNVSSDKSDKGKKVLSRSNVIIVIHFLPFFCLMLMKRNAKFIVRNRAENGAKKQKPMKILIRSNQWMTL